MSVAAGRLAESESADDRERAVPTEPGAGEGPTPEEIQVPVLENVDRSSPA